MTELWLRVYGVAIWSGDEEPYMIMMYITGMFFHAVKMSEDFTVKWLAISCYQGIYCNFYGGPIKLL